MDRVGWITIPYPLHMGGCPVKRGTRRSRANICFLWTTRSQEQEERKSLGNMPCFIFPTHSQIIDSTLLPAEGWGTGWKRARSVCVLHLEGNVKNGKKAWPPTIRWSWRVSVYFQEDLLFLYLPQRRQCWLTPNRLLGQLWWDISVFPGTLKQHQEKAFNQPTPVLYSWIFIAMVRSKFFILYWILEGRTMSIWVRERKASI